MTSTASHAYHLESVKVLDSIQFMDTATGKPSANVAIAYAKRILGNDYPDAIFNGVIHSAEAVTVLFHDQWTNSRIAFAVWIERFPGSLPFVYGEF